MVRKSLEKLYTDSCNIYEYKKVKDPKTKRTTFKNVLVYEDVKCRISFKNITSTVPTEKEAMTKQVTILFINPELNIKPNSIIEVERENRILKYQNSGTPAIYRTHQEIVLNLYEEA